MGPRGVEVNDNPDDMVKAHRLKEKGGIPRKTSIGHSLTEDPVPRPIIGSYRETGLESDFCFDRHARYDPYGYEDEFPDAEEPHVGPSKVQWEDVRWGQLQRHCLAKNEDRYEPLEQPIRNKFWLPTTADQEGVDSTLVLASNESNNVQSYRLWQQNRQSYKKKTALVLRTWDGNEWTIDTVQYVRSQIMELALHSGAEYEVIILVEVKDVKIPIFEDEEAYRQTLLKSVPDEFSDVTILFNRNLLEKWYPKVGVHEYVDESHQLLLYANRCTAQGHPRQATCTCRWSSSRSFAPTLSISGRQNSMHDIPVTIIITLKPYVLGQPTSLEGYNGSAPQDIMYPLSMVHGLTSPKRSQTLLKMEESGDP